MLTIIKELFFYIKNPVLEEDQNKAFNYRFRFFLKLLGISIFFGIALTPIFVIFEEIGWIDMDQHKLEEAFKGMSPLVILLIAGILVPVIEELIFRAPITLFSNPNSFKWAFYVFTLTFGFIHITNYELNTTIWLLSPFLVLPQLIVGISLGFIRVRFGLLWSILLHASYNTILFSISFLAEL
jgi:membrane protease YdiL (CAAX protease family)